jgi:hypothetical protein
MGAANLLDNRAAGRKESLLAEAAPKDFPQVRLINSGGDEQRASTPTFGLMAGANCDAIIPRSISLTMEIQYDSVLDAQQTPLEAYLDAALHAGYPKLGISYCRGFSFTDRRGDETINNVKRTVLRRLIKVELVPHLAATQ